MYTRSKLNKTVTWILLAIALIFILSPFYFIVVNSFKPLSEIAADGFALPKHFGLDNYTTAWTRLKFGRALFNTTAVTILSTVGPIIFGSMAGYWFARHYNKFTKPIYLLMIGSMAIPFQAVMIPFAKVAKAMHLMNSIWGLAVCFWAFSLPISIFLVFGATKSVPLEIEEAAIIDGCSSFMLFWRVVFPLIKPAVMTFSIINIFWYWNDYLMTQMMLTRPALRTIQLSMQTLFNEAFYAWDTSLAALTLSLIPMLIVFTLLQKNVLEGISAGAVKG